VRANQIKVRGCCCGIPFGCGSVLLLLLGLLSAQYGVGAGGFVLAAGAVPVVLAGIGALLWVLGGQEQRDRGRRGASPPA
jgi:hypothetical protein